ncbi:MULTISPECIES: aldo/keto reductase family protein [Methylomicrobium]|uniref:Aldo/keto reductase, diketogulonate reductase n=1 Tax=Methylomicrobium album BG8 TaxID=686340 RepID=H8GJC0_METAL|nr:MULTISPECIES: aldo/keto reductase [Methylomicrobium]EIC29110.1 aldo/keto reductase, diketogulonate reductase [Methylomicrobium album BG8]
MPNPILTISPVIEHRGVSVPTFLYGTAWKENATERLVALALESGFLGIDTANQRRHYFEEGVGEAVGRALASGKLQRTGLFLQSKFTYVSSQDHRLPYDSQASYAVQVEQSLQSSLAHLHTDYLDSYLLHGPASGRGLTSADWEAWGAMENLQESGRVRLIGVSNFSLEQLQLLLKNADIKPAFVQNRCFARTGWDAEIRALCRAHGITYQGFSLLTANLAALGRREMREIAERHGCTVEQAVFRFVLQVGMIPLTGTADPQHMIEDLAVYRLELADEEIELIKRIAF